MQCCPWTCDLTAWSPELLWGVLETLEVGLIWGSMSLEVCLGSRISMATSSLVLFPGQSGSVQLSYATHPTHHNILTKHVRPNGHKQNSLKPWAQSHLSWLSSLDQVFDHSYINIKHTGILINLHVAFQPYGTRQNINIQKITDQSWLEALAWALLSHLPSKEDWPITRKKALPDRRCIIVFGGSIN